MPGLCKSEKFPEADPAFPAPRQKLRGCPPGLPPLDTPRAKAAKGKSYARALPQNSGAKKPRHHRIEGGKKNCKGQPEELKDEAKPRLRGEKIGDSKRPKRPKNK